MEIYRSEITLLPTKFGAFNVKVYAQNKEDKRHYKKEHLVLFTKDFDKLDNPFIRIHSECLTGDVFGSKKCDCGEQLDASLKKIQEMGGMLIYLRQEGRGIGLLNKINAYALQEKGANTVQANEELGFGADEREYDILQTIFKDFGIKEISLITNNPKKVKNILLHDVKIKKRIPIMIPSNKHNKNYLETKKDILGHFL